MPLQDFGVRCDVKSGAVRVSEGTRLKLYLFVESVAYLERIEIVGLNGMNADTDEAVAARARAHDVFMMITLRCADREMNVGVRCAVLCCGSWVIRPNAGEENWRFQGESGR